MPWSWRITPSGDLISLMERLDPDCYLVGPGRTPEEADIDPVFHKGLTAAIGDLQVDLCCHKRSFVLIDLHDWQPADIFQSDPVARDDIFQLTIGEIETGVVLLEHHGELARIRGLFTGPTLVVDAELRANGFGRDLVTARLLVCDGLPTWDHGTPAYTPAGAAAVRSGCRTIRESCDNLFDIEPT